MEDGLHGQSGPTATCGVVKGGRRGLGPALTLLLSMEGLSARECRCRKSPALHCVRVSEMPFHTSRCTFTKVIGGTHHSEYKVA